MATCVPMSELAKVYSIISTVEQAIPFFVPEMYSSLFKATKDTFIGAVFMMSAGMCVVALALAILIGVMLKGKWLSEVVGPFKPPEPCRQDDKISSSVAGKQFYPGNSELNISRIYIVYF